MSHTGNVLDRSSKLAMGQMRIRENPSAGRPHSLVGSRPTGRREPMINGEKWA
jgi:hypothetical protein